MAGRERLFAQLLRWQSAGRIAGAILVATCNRLEFVIDENEAPVDAADLLGDLPHHDHRGLEGTHYLMRVAAGLDSLVRGEDQILGQLRENFKLAEKHGLLSRSLRILRNQIVAVARDVRHRAGISETRVSVASLAARHLENAGSNLVVLGAGETGRLALETLTKRANARILLVNRTLARARALADHFGVEAMSLSDFLANTASATKPEWDGILIAVHTQKPLIKACHLRGMKLAIDVSMPCVYDADVLELAEVETMNLDAVTALAQVECDRRAAALATAEELIRGQASSVHRAITGTTAGLHLANIVDQHIETAMRELQSALDTKLRHLSEADQEQVRQTLLRATRRNAHQHVRDLRELSGA